MVNMQMLINYYLNDKCYFMDILKFDYNNEIMNAFNEQGLKELNEFEYKSYFINYIILYYKHCKELFNRDDFLKLFYETDLSSYYANINYLDEKIKDRIISFGFNNNIDIDKITELIGYTDNNYQLKFLNIKNLSKEILISLFNNSRDFIIRSKIINDFNIYLSELNVGAEYLFSYGKDSFLNNSKNTEKKLKIKPELIDKKFLNNIWEEYNIFRIRKIIDDSEYVTDSSIIDDFISKKEIESINKIDEFGLIEPFSKTYKLYLEYKKEIDDDSYYKYKRMLFKLYNKYPGMNQDNLLEDSDNIYSKLKKSSDKLVSNYIIDYCFKDNYHDVLINLGELLKFYYNGNIKLDDKRVELYNKILNIDLLKFDEKLELFHKMKYMNIMDLFYDDMALARKIRNESFKDYSLTNDDLDNYYNKGLSDKYDVPVCLLNGQSFYGIVKSVSGPGVKGYDKLPTGHSFSLVGPDNLNAFNTNNITYLYDSENLNPNQIVHAFPHDSFSFYRPNECSEIATNRVNKLLTAPELTNKTFIFNEIIIMEKGNEDLEINDKFPELNKIGIYCIDEIRDFEIEESKISNLPIILVNSKAYKNFKESKGNLYYDHYNDTYLDYGNVEDFEKKRM